MPRSFQQFKGGEVTGGRTGNYGAAHGMTDLAEIFGDLNSKAPKFDVIGGKIIEQDASVDSANILGDKLREAYEIEADAITESARLSAKGASAQREGEQKGKVMSVIGQVVGTGLGLALSDETTKNTIEDIENATATLRALRPVTFFYNDDVSENPERRHHGFIAQEYVKVLPEATYFDESREKLCIDIHEVIALLVKANQELEQRLVRLEAKQALQAV